MNRSPFGASSVVAVINFIRFLYNGGVSGQATITIVPDHDVSFSPQEDESDDQNRPAQASAPPHLWRQNNVQQHMYALRRIVAGTYPVRND